MITVYRLNLHHNDASTLDLDLNSFPISHHGPFQLFDLLHGSMSSITKGSIVGLFALAKPVFPGFWHFELRGSEFGAARIVEVGRVHDVMMTAVAKWLRLTRAASTPLVHATSLKFHLKEVKSRKESLK